MASRKADGVRRGQHGCGMDGRNNRGERRTAVQRGWRVRPWLWRVGGDGGRRRWRNGWERAAADKLGHGRIGVLIEPNDAF